MRLWHYQLIPHLPRMQLIGQWRECSSILGSMIKYNTPKHLLVDKIMDYPISNFKVYSELIATEMLNRGYKPNVKQFKDKLNNYITANNIDTSDYNNDINIFLGWHNDIYLRECLYNLEEKFMCGGIEEADWFKIYKHFNHITPLYYKEELAYVQ